MGGGGIYPAGSITQNDPAGSPWGSAGSITQNDPGQSPWGNPFGITQNDPGIGPAYNHVTGGTPLQGYQGGPNRNYNQQGGAWQFNQGFGYQGGPNRNLNQQTNKWQWNAGFGGT